MTSGRTADAIVIGGGLVGLCCAAALARDGGSAIIVDETRPGVASPAAAGMLAPSIDRARGPANDFAVASRDRYPAFLAWLESETGSRVQLDRSGILQVALTPAGVRGLQRAMARDADPAAVWLDAASVRDLEPALGHAMGAVHHPDDGAVDNVGLLAALEAYCRSSPRVALARGAALTFEPGEDTCAVRVGDGTVYHGRYIVLASGAWAPALAGLPRAIPIEPLRGQMLAFPGAPIRHVVFGPRGYLVPRKHGSGAGELAQTGGETLVGATSERVAFDDATTPAAAASLRSAGAEILPVLSHAVATRHWAGLRPMTPDLLPILGPDPERPALLYACGHSRNGILMAPLTGDCVSAMVRGVATPHELGSFTIERFASSSS